MHEQGNPVDGLTWDSNAREIDIETFISNVMFNLREAKRLLDQSQEPEDAQEYGFMLASSDTFMDCRERMTVSAIRRHMENGLEYARRVHRLLIRNRLEAGTFKHLVDTNLALVKEKLVLEGRNLSLLEALRAEVNRVKERETEIRNLRRQKKSSVHKRSADTGSSHKRNMKPKLSTSSADVARDVEISSINPDRSHSQHDKSQNEKSQNEKSQHNKHLHEAQYYKSEREKQERFKRLKSSTPLQRMSSIAASKFAAHKHPHENHQPRQPSSPDTQNVDMQDLEDMINYPVHVRTNGARPQDDGPPVVDSKTGDGEMLVGRKVRKRFSKHGRFYEGEVLHYDLSSGLYRVIYEDSDEEDYDFSDLAEILLPDDVSTRFSLSPAQRRRALERLHEQLTDGDEVDVVEDVDQSAGRDATGLLDPDVVRMRN